jgi:hypothetical protein
LRGHDGGSGHEHCGVAVERGERKRTRSNRPLPEGVVSQGRDRHIRKEVGRGDGLGSGLQEAAEGIGQREGHRPRTIGRHGGVVP